MFKKFNWGYKIAITYIVFVILILSFAYASIRQKNDLVNENYYEQELKFEDKISAIKNYNSLNSEIKINVNANKALEVSFPNGLKYDELKGKVSIYRYSDKNQDLSIKLNLDNNGFQSIPTKLKSGYYNLIIEFNNGREYYFEKQIMIN